MPTETATVAARGYKVNVKKRSDTQVRKEYVAHIHAIAFRVIGETFAALPKAEKVVFSGYSQRPDKMTGKIEDVYLLSVSVDRCKWADLHFASLKLIDHIACFDQFEPRRDVGKSGVLGEICPFNS